MSGGVTITGELPGGIEVDGVKHRSFTLRLPTLLDNIEAIDEVGSSNALAVSAAILTRQLVQLGTLKPDQITYELLAGMHPEDFNVLDLKAQQLEKKRKAQGSSPEPTSSGSDSGSAAPA